MYDSDQTSGAFPLEVPLEHSPNPISTGCVDLSAIATTVHDPSEYSETPDQLCDVCCNIDLAKCFSALCFDCKPHRYHLGKVEDIRSRKGCALCRMISAVHNSAGCNILDVSSEQCTLVNSRSGDEIKVYFTTGGSWDIENRSVIHVIRQCIGDWMIEDWMNKGLRIKSLSAPTGWKKARRIGGRRIEPRQVDFGLIRNWLHVCETSHGDKCNRSGLISKTAGKIRLIDVLSHQIINGITNGRYLALSYVWGLGQQFCLHSQNEGNLRMLHGLKIDSMPRMVRDAINLVAKIGERYLWIDRLCILMDGERDKLEQMSNMDQIYNSATLTIINGDACCSNAPIAGVEPETRRSIQHSEVIRGVCCITTQSELIPEILLTNWSTRGWTYQEGFLSSRCLVFTDYQAYFQYKSDVWCEDSWSTGSRDMDRKSTIGNALCHLPDRDINVSRCSFYQCIDAIEAFSRRRLSVETDTLWAFTGITDTFQPQFPAGFTWGLPAETLDAALLFGILQGILMVREDAYMSRLSTLI